MSNTDLAYVGFVLFTVWTLYATIWAVRKDPLWPLEPARWLYRGWRI